MNCSIHRMSQRTSVFYLSLINFHYSFTESTFIFFILDVTFKVVIYYWLLWALTPMALTITVPVFASMSLKSPCFSATSATWEATGCHAMAVIRWSHDTALVAWNSFSSRLTNASWHPCYKNRKKTIILKGIAGDKKYLCRSCCCHDSNPSKFHQIRRIR